MKIIWDENPLKTIVELDDRDRLFLLANVRNEKYERILATLSVLLETNITIKTIKNVIKGWIDICDMGFDEVKRLEESLQDTHMSDCVTMSCTKCQAEDYLEINTLEGLNQSDRNYIMRAFQEDRGINEAIDYLAEPIDPTAPDTWLRYGDQAEYEKHIPKWDSEKKQAHDWLVEYRKEHFPSEAKAAEKKFKCDVVFDFCSPHNGEYWHICKTCGARDWVAYYDKFENDKPLRRCKYKDRNT